MKAAEFSGAAPAGAADEHAADGGDFGLPMPDLFRQVAACIEQVLWIANTARTRVIFVSPAFERIWGRACRAVCTQPRGWLDTIHSEDRPRVAALMQSPLGAGYTVEYRIRRPDGAERWIREHAFPLRDATGAVCRVAGIAQDITRQKHGEHERERLVRLIEHSRDFISMADAEGRLTYLNLGGRRMIGWPEHQELGQLRFTDYVPPQWLPFFHNTVLRMIREKGSWEGEMQLQHLQTRALIDVFRSTFLVRDPLTREPLGFATVTRDITLAKKLERELLESGERERQQVGHELHDGLGQHLHAIYYLSTLLDQALREEGSRHAAKAARLSRLLKQAAALTRGLAQGLQPVSPVPEGLMAALRELARHTRAVYGVECRLTCRQPVLLASNAVATHLFRIAQEAVSNAVKHGQPRRIQIGLTSGAGRVILGVKDDGSGIRTARRARRGMGLHVMQHRAGAIDGTLAIQRLPHGGTEVVCSIPIPAACEGESPATPKFT